MMIVQIRKIKRSKNSKNSKNKKDKINWSSTRIRTKICYLNVKNNKNYKKENSNFKRKDKN